ncbi:MAG: DUF6941 family protein [Mycobacteriales bacterium]
MPEIEFVAVANHAEAMNGLLYLSGAGWTELRQFLGPNGTPAITHFGIGVSVLVGWNEANTRFPLALEIVSEDGGEPLVKVGGQIEQGRPPGVRAGADLRSVLALNAEVQFPTAGGYEVRVAVGSGKPRSVSFYVRAPAQLPQGTPPSAD